MMRKNEIPIAVIEDHPASMKRIQSLLYQLGCRKLFCFSSAADYAQSHLHPMPIVSDILDEQGMPAYAYFHSLPDHPLVVYFSAYREHAVNACGMNTAAFLLKKEKDEILLSKLEQILSRLLMQDGCEFKTWYSKEKIPRRHIEMIESCQGQILLWLKQKEEPVILSERTLQDCMNKLDSAKFVQISRSCIAALDAIASVSLAGRSIRLFSGRILMVSRRRWKNFLQRWFDQSDQIPINPRSGGTEAWKECSK